MRRRRAGGSSGATFAFAGLLALTLAVSGVLVSAPPASANEDCVTPTAAPTAPAPSPSATPAPSLSATTPPPTAPVCPVDVLTFEPVSEWPAAEFVLSATDPAQTVIPGATVTGFANGEWTIQFAAWVIFDDDDLTYTPFYEDHTITWGPTAFGGFTFDPATGTVVVSESALWDARYEAAQGPIDALIAAEFAAFQDRVAGQAEAIAMEEGYEFWDFQGDSEPTWWTTSGLEATLELNFSNGGCPQTAVLEPSFPEDD